MFFFRRFIWNFLRLENEHLNNCGQFRAVRDISIRPITVNEIEGVDGEEKGPLRTLKRRASEILGITDQHPSVTAARRRSSGELGRRLSISGATRRPSITNQDEPTSVTSVSPSTDILTTGVTRKRKYTLALFLSVVVLDIKDLDIVIKELTTDQHLPCAVWHELDLQLGLYDPRLVDIETDCKGKAVNCFRECMSAWLKGEDKVIEKGGPSWSSLATALDTIEEKAIASNIRDKI